MGHRPPGVVDRHAFDGVDELLRLGRVVVVLLVLGLVVAVCEVLLLV